MNANSIKCTGALLKPEDRIGGGINYMWLEKLAKEKNIGQEGSRERKEF